MKAAPFMESLKESAAQFWEARDARERKMLAAGAVVVLLSLIYLICFAPALSGRARLAKELPELRQQSLQLQTLARHAAELNNSLPPAPPALTQEGVAASLQALGMKPQSLSVSGDLVHLQLNPVSFAGLANWTNQQRIALRLEVVDANFVALQQKDTASDMVNATLTLHQQHGGE
ncbi:MAG: type II secretion system protein M [Burkholderiaceae bacterium]|nr:type II secretion system protein M [Burkholderiaceae bacterium]